MRIINLVLDFVRVHKFLIGGISPGMFLISVSATENSRSERHELASEEEGQVAFRTAGEVSTGISRIERTI
jgi:hypothetical protein